jgi:hypothetical protein
MVAGQPAKANRVQLRTGSAMLTSAPWSRSKSTHSSIPALAAAISAVYPSCVVSVDAAEDFTLVILMKLDYGHIFQLIPAAHTPGAQLGVRRYP